IGGLPSRAQVVRQFLHDCRPGVCYDEFKWQDWKPGLVEAASLIAMVLGWAIHWTTRVGRGALRALGRRCRTAIGSPTRRATLAVLRDSEIRSVHGNHDLMAVGRLPRDDCGPVARKAIRWTQTVLTEEDRHYLASLPSELYPQRSILCVHSAPGDPLVRLRTSGQFYGEYLRIGESDPEVRLCFTGHTHVARAMMVTPRGEVLCPLARDIALDPAAFYFVNPGSVGCPRAGDYRP